MRRALHAAAPAAAAALLRSRCCRCRTLRRSAHAAASAPPSRSPTHRAVLVDVGGATPAASPALPCAPESRSRWSQAGCLLSPAEPVADTYVRYATAHGVAGLTHADVSAGFKRAFAASRAPGAPRYVGDGAAFWRAVVAAATGCADEALYAALFTHYEAPAAWCIAPGAQAALRRLRAAGVRLAVVSNWDTRLGPLLDALQLSPLFDAVIVSAELGYDKPDERVFAAALAALNAPPAAGGPLAAHEALMVGDDEANDVAGARAAGCDAALWGREVTSFAQLAARVLRDVDADT